MVKNMKFRLLLYISITLIFIFFIMRLIPWQKERANLFSQIQPYNSQLDKTILYIDLTYKEKKLNKLLKSYATEFDKILKNPKLESNQLNMVFNLNSPKDRIVSCLHLLNKEGSLSLIEDIQGKLISTKETLLRYHAYESQFYGKVLELNNDIKNFDEDCVHF